MQQLTSLPLGKVALALLGVAAAGYALICLVLWAWQPHLIFKPTRSLERTPADAGASYEQVWVPLEETGERLYGWWLPSAARDARPLLYLHGNGGTIGINLEQAQLLRALGFSVLLVDYRGYGRSDGPFPNEQRVYQDAKAAWRYLVRQRGYAPERIWAYGHSLGGAVAIELATRHPAMAGVITEATFTSIANMARHRGPYELIPLEQLLTQRFDSLAKVRSLEVPLLLIHGTEDAVVPARMSQALYEAASDPKQLLLVPGANHCLAPHSQSAAVLAASKYRQAIRTFVERNAAVSSR
ncbi:MAG: phospholipase [Cyanobacteria bacterium QS_8_64_29]|nr:MAG: phospholipase [Cyanobacteria bacterium QS_8_64_29]